MEGFSPKVGISKPQMAGIKKGKGKGEIPAHKNAKGVPDMSMLLGFE